MKLIRPLLRSTVCAILVAGISACGIVYKLPTRQGNVLEQESWTASRSA